MKRNRGKRGYRGKQAHELAVTRRFEAEKCHTMTADIASMVTKRLLLDHNPDQISGALKLQGISISHERIYQFVLEDKRAGGLYQYLRQGKKRRKKRYGSHDRRGQIKNRVSIEERPAVVEKKERLGDWKGDKIIGKQQQKAIVTLVDRATKLTRIGTVATKRAPVVSDIIIGLLKPLESVTHTHDYG